MNMLIAIWFSPVLLLVAPYVLRAIEWCVATVKALRCSYTAHWPVVAVRFELWIVYAKRRFTRRLDALHVAYVRLVHPDYYIRLQFLMLMST